jgi:hypothetical protein
VDGKVCLIAALGRLHLLYLLDVYINPLTIMVGRSVVSSV